MRAGGTPVMLPLTDDTDILAQCAERFDAFLFTGGPDVGPMVGAAASATGRSEVLSLLSATEWNRFCCQL